MALLCGVVIKMDLHFGRLLVLYRRRLVVPSSCWRCCPWVAVGLLCAVACCVRSLSRTQNDTQKHMAPAWMTNDERKEAGDEVNVYEKEEGPDDGLEERFSLWTMFPSLSWSWMRVGGMKEASDDWRTCDEPWVLTDD